MQLFFFFLLPRLPQWKLRHCEPVLNLKVTSTGGKRHGHVIKLILQIFNENMHKILNVGRL